MEAIVRAALCVLAFDMSIFGFVQPFPRPSFPPGLPRPASTMDCTTVRAAQRTQQDIYGLLEGRGRTLSVRLAKRGPCAVPFAVDANQVVLHLVSDDTASAIDIRPAQRGRLTARKPTTGVLSWSPGAVTLDLSFRLPDNLPADMYKPAISGALSANIYPLRVYVPTTTRGDPDLKQTRERYLNRTVFPRGGLRVECMAHDAARSFVQVPFDQSLRVVAVTRSAGPGEIWTLGGITHNSLDNAANFLSLQPIVIEFARESFHAVASGGESPAAAIALMRDTLKCGRMRSTLSDLWEIERVLSFEHPYNRPEWPQAFRDALKAQKILPGMSHEMVAAVLGYPSTYAPIAELDRLARWDYVASAPFSSSVLFSGDRVVRYNPPGNLP